MQRPAHHARFPPNVQLPHLPICHIIPELKNALSGSSAVLAAPPGSGKTTIVPLLLLDEGWLADNRILILEPRRLAVRAAAGRMASLLGERVGQTIGYQIRFDRKISRSTRIEVLTEGILTRRIQDDAGLNGVGLIIFDEFHERSLHADLALALCLDLCQVRDDLRLLVMSATLDTAPVSRLLGKVPVITGEGQAHEVRTEYLQRPATGRISDITTLGVRRVVREQQGDVLVFLPGTGEIKEVHRQLGSDPGLRDILVLPLFGDLSQEAQDRAILADPGGRRRVILATSIAETSLTIEGVGCVVDSGWSRRLRFDPGNGLSRLLTLRVSQAAANQRSGRAGRLGPGYCLRLWTREEQQGLVPFHPPEILAADLASLALELALWGVGDPSLLLWLDPPRSGPYRQARELLHSLKAVNDSGGITDIGRQLAALPIHPRLGYMLLMAQKMHQVPLACDIAAILSERDNARRDVGNCSVDIRLRLSLLQAWREKGAEAVSSQGGDPALCRRIDLASRQWLKLLAGKSSPHNPDTIGDLLVSAYPDRIARRRQGERGRFILATGRGVVLSPVDPLSASDYLVVPQLDAGKKEGKIFLAESLDISVLKNHHGDLFSASRLVCWDAASARVIATRRLNLGEIVIEESSLTDMDSGEISRAMLAGIRQMGIECLPWDRESRQFQVRVGCLRGWQPEMAWPDLSDKELLRDLGWLEPYLVGLNTAELLKKMSMQKILESMLGWEMRQKLARDAPISITVPSGAKIRIEYSTEGSPRIAVRIQEMFGQFETPAICAGKIPLLLHLLSPARRPIQITADLAGFWQHGYPEVKKELKGRYPKHFWPDDPLAAEATRGIKRKNISTSNP